MIVGGWLRESGAAVALTGAGVSAESGIPTFRDAMEGLWAAYDPQQLATPEGFARDPETVTRWYDWRRVRCLTKQPNPGHHAIAEIERQITARGGRFSLLTQNVDRMHQRAGSRNVVELHGTIHAWRCTETGREVELLRDPDYWGNGKPDVDQPYLDRLKFRVINNFDAALIRLKSGSLDYIDSLQPVQHVRGTDSERFKREFQKYEYYAPTYTYIGWNNDHPIFRDKRVRQAMTYLTDRKQIVKSVLFGLGEVVDSPIYLFRPEYDKSLKSYPFDPQKGFALLHESGCHYIYCDVLLDNIIYNHRVPLIF